MLCNCKVGIIVFGPNDRLYQYASSEMDNILMQYTASTEPHESKTNEDVVRMLRRKGGCGEEGEFEASDEDSPLGFSPTEEPFPTSNSLGRMLILDGAKKESSLSDTFDGQEQIQVPLNENHFNRFQYDAYQFVEGNNSVRHRPSVSCC